MTTTPFSQAERVAREALDGGSVSLHEWAQAAAECARSLAFHQLEDQAVRAAAALGPVVASPATTVDADSPLVQAFSAARHHPLEDSHREVAQRQARTALLFATHAATRDAGELGEVMLGTVERDLIGPASIRAEPFEQALRKWGDALGRHAVQHTVTPHLAMAIAHNQQAILTLGKDLLSHVDENPEAPGSIDRLKEGVDTSLRSWRDASQRLRMGLGRTVPDEDKGRAASLSMASQDLRGAMRIQVSPAEQLDALLATGFGGNMVATVLIGDENTGRALPLIRAAQHLQQAGAPLIGQRSGPPFIDRAILAAATPVPADPPQVEHSDPAPVREQHQEPVVDTWMKESRQVAAVYLTPEIENELAKRRDVGILAQAALDSEPAAQAVVEHVFQQDLARLATEGRKAQAQMVVSVIPMMRGRNKWFRDRDEAFQHAAMAMTDAAARWDPEKSRWLTYAGNVATWAALHSAKRLAKAPIPQEFAPNEAHEWVHEQTVDPADKAVDELMRREMMDQVQRLPKEFKTIILGKLGLEGEAPKTFVEIGRELGMSDDSVSLRYRQGIRMVQQVMDTPEQSAPPPQPQTSITELQERVEALRSNGGSPEAPLERVQRRLRELQENPTQRRLRELRENPATGPAKAPTAQRQPERDVTRDL